MYNALWDLRAAGVYKGEWTTRIPYEQKRKTQQNGVYILYSRCRYDAVQYNMVFPWRQAVTWTSTDLL